MRDLTTVPTQSTESESNCVPSSDCAVGSVGDCLKNEGKGLRVDWLGLAAQYVADRENGQLGDPPRRFFFCACPVNPAGNFVARVFFGEESEVACG